MATQDGRAPAKFERTSVLISGETMAALRALAEKHDRPLARELRRAVDEYVERESLKAAA